MELSKVMDRFLELYGGEREGIRVFQSPGRVNLIGEHTDYNGGYVFPAAISMRSLVVARPRPDRQVHLSATDLQVVVRADLDRLDEFRDLKWGNYQLGVADELQKNGHQLVGCDLLFDDTVPLGSGLSSSAAIQVASALVFTTLEAEAKGMPYQPDMVYLAKIAQQSERHYIGVQCGIMDQFASATGKENHAILLNCKTLETELVPIRLQGYKIVLANTNKKRSLADSKYNERCTECQAGFEILKKVLPHIECLGDVTKTDWDMHASAIEDPIVRKRVEHVVLENARVLESVEALKQQDLLRFGALLKESHASLRDLYEVTGKELDTLVDAAQKAKGCIGSRMTGAGFGGCSISIVKEEQVEDFQELVGQTYKETIGYAPTFYITDIGDGGKQLL